MKKQSPQHVDAAERPAPASRGVSHKAMGISCLFFGIVSSVGAVANWASGHPVHSGTGSLRLLLSAVMSLGLLALGIMLVHKEP